MTEPERQRRYGSIVTETFTAAKRYGTINESMAECFWSRESMFSQFVDENIDLSLMYARPEWKHASYVEGDGSVDSERCAVWTMVYRYYPQAEPKRADALQASLDYFAAKS